MTGCDAVDLPDFPPDPPASSPAVSSRCDPLGWTWFSIRSRAPGGARRKISTPPEALNTRGFKPNSRSILVVHRLSQFLHSIPSIVHMTSTGSSTDSALRRRSDGHRRASWIGPCFAGSCRASRRNCGDRRVATHSPAGRVHMLGTGSALSRPQSMPNCDRFGGGSGRGGGTVGVKPPVLSVGARSRQQSARQPAALVRSAAPQLDEPYGPCPSSRGPQTYHRPYPAGRTDCRRETAGASKCWREAPPTVRTPSVH